MKVNNLKQILPKKVEAKAPLTEAQRQKRKKMVVYPLMVLLFMASLWLIFKPTPLDNDTPLSGFNTEIPLPTETAIIGDKETAYKQEQLEQKQKERLGTMQDLESLFSNSDDEKDNISVSMPLEDGQSTSKSLNSKETSSQRTIHSSVSAYRDMNKTLNNFYETPEADSEKEELQKRIDELESRLSSDENPQITMNDQVALLEKSYELAAKYMPSGQTAQTLPSVANTETNRTGNTNQQELSSTVSQPTTQVASALVQPISDSVLIAEYSQLRKTAFYTAVGNSAKNSKNTITACIHDDQTITSGSSVRIRLLEPICVEGTIIPRNTVAYGRAGIQGERLSICITSLEYNGMITPINLQVYDSDGQLGIFIPDRLEMSSLKEVTANMGTSLGSSVSISTDAGAQLASDLGKSVIQGTSQYLSQKMSTVKVHLKAGYKIMLYQPTR